MKAKMASENNKQENQNQQQEITISYQQRERKEKKINQQISMAANNGVWHVKRKEMKAIEINQQKIISESLEERKPRGK